MIGRQIFQNIYLASNMQSTALGAGAGIGAIFGFGQGLATEKNTLINTAGWGMLGASVGVGAAVLTPYAKKGFADIRGSWEMLGLAEGRYNEKWAGMVRRNQDLSQATKNRLLGLYQSTGVTPESHLARAPRMTLQDIQARVGRTVLSTLGVTNFDDPDLLSKFIAHNKNTKVPFSLKLGVLGAASETIFDEDTLAKLGLPGRMNDMSASAINEFLQGKYNTWEDLFGALTAEGVDQERFLSRFTHLAEEYHGMGIKDQPIVGPEMTQVAGKVGTWSPRGTWEHMAAVNPIDALRAQGKGEIADALSSLPSDWTVRAYTYQDKEMAARLGNPVVELAIGTGAAAESQTGKGPGWLRIPLVEKGGVIRRGTGGKDTYVPRQMFDPEEVQGLVNLSDPDRRAAKLTTYSTDIWAARMISKLRGRTRSQAEINEVMEWIQKEVTASNVFDVSPYRSSRRGLQSRILSKTRGMESRIPIPGSKNIANIMGLSEDYFDPTMGRIKPEIFEALWNRPEMFYAAGSEGSTRSGVVMPANAAVNLSWGAAEQSPEKALRFLRDYTKGYQVGYTGTGLNRYQWMPVATPTARDLVGTTSLSAPLAARYMPIMDTELEVLRDLIAIRNGSNDAVLHPKIAAMTSQQREQLALEVLGENKKSQFMDDLRTVSNMAEGQVATAIGRDYVQRGIKQVTVDMLSPELGKQLGVDITDIDAVNKHLQQMGGVDIDPSMIGISRNTREGVRGTFASSKYGRTRLMNVARSQHGFALELVEDYPMANAKIGTAMHKSYTMDINRRNAFGIMKVFQRMRTSSTLRGAGFYAGQTALATKFEAGGLANIALGFARASDLKATSSAEQMMREIVTGYTPRMSNAGKMRFYREVKEIGGKVKSVGRGRYTLTTPTFANPQMAEDYTVQMQRLAMGIFAEPEKYFAKGFDPLSSFQGTSAATMKSIFARGARARSLTGVKRGFGVLSGLMFQRGMTTDVVAWDTREMNIPKHASMTLPEIQFYKQMGFSETYKEFLGRRHMVGDPTETAKFFDINYRASKMGANADLSKMATRYGLEDIPEIAGFDLLRRAKMPIEDRTGFIRGGKKFANNWVLDLGVAEDVMAGAGARVTKLQQALGGTQFIIPGTSTDLWKMGAMTEAGGYIEADELARSVRDLARHSTSYLRGNEGALDLAVDARTRYLKELYDRQISLQTGRAGATFDVGPSFAGRVMAKNYRRDLIGRVGADNKAIIDHAVGISQEMFDELVRKGARKVRINNLDVLVGTSVRYPVTSADPIFAFADPNLDVVAGRHGIAMDEAIRKIKQLDFDGDTLYAKFVKSKGAVDELMGAMKSSDSLYKELLRATYYTGGVEEDIMAKTANFEDENLVKTLSKRIEKMGPLSKSSIEQRMGKYATSYIGEYVNISKRAGMMLTASDLGEQSITAGALRSRYGDVIKDVNLANEIKITGAERRAARMVVLDQVMQQAIDFSRHSKLGPGADPSKMANQMRRALANIARGNVEEGSQAFGQIMDKLGIRQDQMERFTSQLKIGGNLDKSEVVRRQYIFEEALDDFFSGVNVKEAREMEMIAMAAQKKGMHFAGSLADIQAQYDEMLEATVRGGMRGEFPAIGKRGSKETSELISGFNKHIKRVATMVGEIGQQVPGWIGQAMKTPQGRGAAGLAALTLGGLGVLGIMTPPVSIDAPSQRALQRTPDTAFVGADGRAPIPGARYGNVQGASQQAFARPYQQSPSMSRRFYYQKTNKMPNISHYSVGREVDTIGAAQGALNQGAGVNINVVSHPSARRLTEAEMDSRFREDMLN